MQKEMKFYLGMDVSKSWLDLAILPVIAHQRQGLATGRFDNTAAGIQSLHKWVKKQGVQFNENSLLVIENTGVYHRRIWQYCSDHGLPIYIGNAADIKWSLGITRGKNDVIDSQRLCLYACKQAEELKATPVLNSIYLKLKDLMTARTRLVEQKGSIKVYLGELALFNDAGVQQMMEQAHKAVLKGVEKSLQQVEDQLEQVLKEDAAIHKSYTLLRTVPGIGHLTAIYLICSTNNFAGNRSGKQVASYAGVVPFSHTSGTSIKGRNKVHKMANKDLKKLLYMCAMAAVKYYPEFAQYYERKKAEGKHGMVILNAIKNKLVLRAVAVVNNQTPYVDNYVKAA